MSLSITNTTNEFCLMGTPLIETGFVVKSGIKNSFIASRILEYQKNLQSHNYKSYNIQPKKLQIKPTLNCDGLSYNMCVDLKDENNLRKCRFNFENKECENLPEEYRERATYQIGGNADIKCYSSIPKKLDKSRFSAFQ